MAVELPLTHRELNEQVKLVIGYPKPTNRVVASRLKLLRRMGVVKLIPRGRVKIGGFNVLGKGYVGIVVLVETIDKGKAVLKLRRVDASRRSLEVEGGLLRRVNKLGIGPRLLAVSKNALLMEYIEGEDLEDWLAKEDLKPEEVKRVLRETLEQCYRLDVFGIDHGELSIAKRHVRISKEGRPVILDFESASLRRRPANVTSLTQYLFVRKSWRKNKLERLLGSWSVRELVEALRAYKREPSRQNFEKLLKILNLA